MPNYIVNKLTVTGSKWELSTVQRFVRLGNSPFSLQKIVPMPMQLNLHVDDTIKLLAYIYETKYGIVYAQSHPLDDDDRRLLGVPENAALTQRDLAEIRLQCKRNHFTDWSLQFHLDDDIGNLLQEQHRMRDKLKYHVFRDEQEMLIAQTNLYIQNFDRFLNGSWYDWCLENWGTKWEIDPLDISFSEGKDSLCYRFISANSAPDSAIRKLSKQFQELLFELKFSDSDYANDNYGFCSFEGGQQTTHAVTDKGQFFKDVLGEGYDAFEKQ